MAGNKGRCARFLFAQSKPYIGRIILIMLYDLACTVVSLAAVALSKVIIDYASEGKRFTVFVVVYIVLTVLNLVGSAYAGLFGTMLSEKFSFGLRRRIYEGVLHSKWQQAEKVHTGDYMTRLTSDISKVSDGILIQIPGVLRTVTQLILGFLMLFHYSKLLALLALGLTPVVGLASYFLMKKLKTVMISVQETETEYRSFLQESLANLLIIKSFSNEDYNLKRYDEIRAKRLKSVLKRTRLSLTTSFAYGLVFQLGYILAFAYGADRIAAGAVTFGTMSVFLSLINRVQGPIIQLGSVGPQLAGISASCDRIMEIDDIEKEVAVSEDALKNFDTSSVGVRISDMNFKYENADILSGVNIDIKGGECIGVIGESGIGKTTLIHLVMAYLKPYTGNVSVVDKCGHEAECDILTRCLMAYVPQKNTLISGTIRDNLYMANHDASDEELWEALRIADAYDFVRAFPGALDTIVGEKGNGLSEGQAQRISIARALLKKTPILILDEATGGLDINTEKRVLENLRALEKKPTVLFITHRESVLTICDRVFSIKGERVTEC